MLLNLHVKNLAIIDEIEVSFSEGLNVLTGETGAGKSIIIGSVSMALGGKIPKGIIREGKEEALVELLFSVDEYQETELKNAGIFADEGQIILSRRISESRTINRINGENATVTQLKNVARILLDIHGQNEQQSLLNIAKHREILDYYAKEETEKVKENLGKAYSEYKKIHAQIEENDIPESERNREISYLTFEMDEINAVKPKHGEEDELEVRYKKLTNSQNIAKAMDEVHYLTSSDSSMPDNASSIISRALHEINTILVYDDAIKDYAEELSQIDALLNDFSRDISDYMKEFVVNEEEITRISERLDRIRLLKSKYGQTTSEIYKYADNIKDKLEAYQKHDELMKKLEDELSEQKEIIKDNSQKLSAIRKNHAKKLDKEIIKALQDLNFAEVKFETQIRKMERFTADGSDEVEFMISLNPGVEMKPLGQAASGGELSRVMLAIKTVLAKQDMIPTLIFDEIDVGISGRTAQMVAEKMSYIARMHQVIAISHLAQIAAMADTHFLIEKVNDESHTQTDIRRLNEEESVNELARILGGVSITDSVITSAKEMKKLALEKKSIL